MPRAILPVAALAALAAAAAPARADGTYFSLGMGPGEVSDELGAHVHETFAARIALGHRVGALAIEGYVGPESGTSGPSGLEAVRLGLDARYVVPLSSGVQFYARGGLVRMDATLGSSGYVDRGRDYTGRGVAGGVGVQLRGKVRALGFLYWPMFFLPVGPKVNAAVFVDHGTDFYRLHPVDGPGRTFDARITRLTFGFNVGADF